MSTQSAMYRPGNGPREERLPRFVVGAAIFTIFAVNLAILGYAVWTSRPETGAVPESVVTLDAKANGVEESVPGIGGAEAFDGDEEDLDWALEPIRVVNIFEVPGLEETRPQFIHHCAGCHGIDGTGNGPAADDLVPRPRDFIGSEFRYATTGSTPEHVLADLTRTISRGVPRSAMPGFGGVLTETEIAGLARYILNIREQGEQLAPAERPIDIGERPPITPQLVDRGRELYTSLSCNTCHGDTGRGDGMNAASLVDFQGRPVRPADFTSGLFKTGQTPEDLCRTILRGVPGTPMVAYEAVLATENEDGTLNTMDAWALVAYIRSFATRPRPPGVPSGATIVADIAPDEAMIFDPAHAAWLGIEPVLIAVKPLRCRPERTTFIEVRAARSARRIALCLDWRDATLDVARGEGIYPDAVAVGFGLGDGVPPLLTAPEIEDVEAAEPVNAWSWAADRQWRAVTARQGAGEENGTWYLFVYDSRARLPALSAPGAPDITQTGPAPAGPAVLETNAAGINRVTVQPPEQQSTDGAAAWSTGSWRVVMSRALTTDDEADVQFSSVRRIPVTFAFWDGAKGDHGADRLTSSWHWLAVNR